MAEGASKEGRGEWIPPVETLTEDLLVEILSRVPYKSVIRSKCVSPRWRRVISHPDHRNQLPRYQLQGLAGFFLSDKFINVTGEGRPLVDPSFPFLPRCVGLELLDSCNGLVLCRRWRNPNAAAVVVNPATQHWVTVPDSGWSNEHIDARLGFDPVVSSSHFHVFEFVGDHADWNAYVIGVEIYSSETGAWSHRDNGWGCKIRIVDSSSSVFFNNALHLVTLEGVVAAVDVEGNTWRIIPVPQNEELYIYHKFIDLSRGCLYFVNTNTNARIVSVWVLEDYTSEQWTLKHTVSLSRLLVSSVPAIHPERDIIFDTLHLERDIFFDALQHYEAVPVAIHPERDIIFLDLPRNRVLVSYEMDTGEEVHFTYEPQGFSELRYLRYVALHSGSLADGY